MSRSRRILALAGLLILLASLVILLLSVVPSVRTTSVTPLAPGDLLPPTEEAHRGGPLERHTVAADWDDFL